MPRSPNSITCYTGADGKRYQRSTGIAKKLIKALQCPCPIGENVAVSLPCFHRKQGRFEKGLRLRIESGHPVEEAFGSLRFQLESPRQLPKVLATMEPVLFEALRLELIGKQLQREGAFLRQVQPRVQEIVGWAEDMVPERRRHEGEVLEVGVAVDRCVVEDDQQEELLDFDRIGRALTLQDPTDFLVAAIVFEVPSVSFTAAARQLAEILL